MEVLVSSVASKSLKKAPPQVYQKFLLWVSQINLAGIEAVRKIASFHDEPLKGQRQNQRSIRLNRQWRVIYRENQRRLVIEVLEVTPHDYRL